MNRLRFWVQWYFWPSSPRLHWVTDATRQVLRLFSMAHDMLANNGTLRTAYLPNGFGPESEVNRMADRSFPSGKQSALV